MAGGLPFSARVRPAVRGVRRAAKPWPDRDWAVVESQRNRRFGWGPSGRAL